MNEYSYVVIKHNYSDLAKESTFFESKYKKTKYAALYFTVHKDKSETFTHIIYSNNLEELQNKANVFLSWYNYPLNLCKNIQGYIKHINT